MQLFYKAASVVVISVVLGGCSAFPFKYGASGDSQHVWMISLKWLTARTSGSSPRALGLLRKER
jgi:hypothetical protein